MKYLCLLALLLSLPVSATAQQQRRTDDRRSTERGSGERQSGERHRDRGKHDDRDNNDRGTRDRDNRPTTSRFDPRVPSWQQNQAPWWERQPAPWWERGRTARPASNANSNDYDDYRDRRRHNGGGVVYVVPSYPYFQDSTTTTTVVTPSPPAPVIGRTAPAPNALPAIGFLNLAVEPRALLQIYVDDVFFGTPGDLGDELKLSPGTRRIELRARGYKPLMFSAEIVENRSINYRGTLERDPAAVADPPPAPRAPVVSGPTTMYMIQGCYLGNIAPKAGDLRPGCDIAKLVTFKP